MGLFKDFKEDLKQAVDEMLPMGAEPEEENVDNLVVDTLNEKVDVETELSKLDGLLEQVNPAPEPTVAKEEPKPVRRTAPSAAYTQEQTVRARAAEPVSEANDLMNQLQADLEQSSIAQSRAKENRKMSDSPMMNTRTIQLSEASEEVSVITESTNLTGDIQSSGSFEIRGTINGNVICNGKITVTGTINGNSNSSEFFADVAKVEGEVVSTGTVKIGTGSVIIGNISAASAVIAGAVKGDIDVQGPVVVDTSAVIMGNIKSRSVQINNGAVIEGFCSQCYADVDVQGLFDNNNR